MSFREQLQACQSETSSDESVIKKRRMIQCLQEIQSLVDSDTASDKDKVLNTLQSVVIHMKKMQSKFRYLEAAINDG